MRGERMVEYPYTTYSTIFSPGEPEDSPLHYALFMFLSEMFIKGVPQGEFSSVSQGDIIPTNLERKEDDMIVKYCQKAKYHGHGKEQHTIVQEYFLENDPYTIAIEVPVYGDGLLGHIDILRILDNRIQVLDFKPKAGQEKKAASQVFRYRKLLSAHIFEQFEKHGLSLPDGKMYTIEALYFDEYAAYYLK